MSAALSELVEVLTSEFSDGNTDPLDAILLRVCEYLGQEIPVTKHVLDHAIKVVNEKFKSNGADVPRKRFLLVRLLAPSEEHLEMRGALEHACFRKLTEEEVVYFARVQTRWRNVLLAVGKSGNPKFADLVTTCVAELELCLPRNALRPA